MAPAELIPRSAQSRVISAILWCVVASVFGFLAWVGYSLLRRRNYQFSLLSLLALMTAVAILVVIWPAFQSLVNGLALYPPERLLPARGWGTLSGEQIRTQSGFANDLWAWSAVQWIVYSGPWLSVALAIGLIASWLAWRGRG